MDRSKYFNVTDTVVVGNTLKRRSIEAKIVNKIPIAILGVPNSGKLSIVREICQRHDYTLHVNYSEDCDIFGSAPLTSQHVFAIRNPRKKKSRTRLIKGGKRVVFLCDEKAPKGIEVIAIRPPNEKEVEKYEELKGMPMYQPFGEIRKENWEKYKIQSAVDGEDVILPENAWRWYAWNFRKGTPFKIAMLASRIPKYFGDELLKMIRARDKEMEYPRWLKLKQ